MQLSILIPTYNYQALALVRELSAQIDTAGIEGEIIIGDDASTIDMAWLFEAEQVAHVRLWQTAENLGRSRIRNALARVARGEWLLFVDCDAVVTRPDFLATYLQPREADVLCGGIATPEDLPSEDCTLRWRYEREAEKRFRPELLNAREDVPFRTFNFMMRRSDFLAIGFDERIRRYGYEDVLFGIELTRRGLKVLYIDNPLLNGDLEPNEVFLSKTEEALRTLREVEAEVLPCSPIAQVAQRLRRLHFAWFVGAIFWLTRPLLRWNLLSHHPSLNIFAFYKLGFYL